MSRTINIEGNKYGKLTAIKRVENNKRGQAVWECMCDCGKISFTLTTRLIKGHTTSCGCNRKTSMREKYMKDISGLKFNRLLVLHESESRAGNRVTWACQCDCGKIIKVSGKEIRGGHTKSCGCLKHERNTIGQKGHLSHLWKGGKTKESVIIRQSAEYKKWRDAVFVRDSYKCQKCGIRNGKDSGNDVKLNAHHISPFSTHIELRFEITNGVTLCRECHAEEDHQAARFYKKSKPTTIILY